MKRPDYRRFIEDNFLIRDEDGKEQAFRFRQTQASYYDLLTTECPTLQGLRENVLKARQEGFSSLIDAILTTDFILSGLKRLPAISGQIISHKDAETRILFRRVDYFLTSFLKRRNVERAKFLKTDTDTYLETHTGAELYIGTAGAKTLGRGGTLQNIHWSEVAFYPNTAVLNATEIVPPAEQQVKDGVGKIFRETTGNRMFDFFYDEYQAGKVPGADFKSRFFPWFVEKKYTRPAPDGWRIPSEYAPLVAEHGLTADQVYWHWRKVTKPKDGDTLKARREYPSTDIEAFLAAGEQYFDAEALMAYKRLGRFMPLPRGNVFA